MKRFPAVKACLIAGASLMALAGIAKADDHLFQATEFGGLSEEGQPFQENPAGHSGDLAPGQGSPFTGDDTQTPATDTEAANDHANVKDREPK
jgi:hypothetical protein